jgi:hypothetical protein
LLTELKNVNDGKDKAIEDARKDMVKDENDVSDILSGLKQVDDDSNIGLIESANSNSDNTDDLFGSLKQVDSDII